MNRTNGWGALGQMLGGSTGTPGVYEKALQDNYNADYALQRARKERGDAIRSLVSAESFQRLPTLGDELGRSPAEMALLTAGGGNAQQLAAALGSFQEQGFRGGAVDDALGGNWDGANARMLGVANGPVQLATVEGQNLINNRFLQGGGGVASTEQGRSAALKNQRQVFDAGQGGVYTLDLDSSTASPVDILGGGMGVPRQRTLGDDPFASLHAELPGLRVTSQHRTAQRNTDVGGATNSYHLTGEAIDIGTPSAEQQAGLRQWAAQNGYEIINNYNDGHWHLEPKPGARPPLGGRQLVNTGGARSGQNAPSGYRFTAGGNLEAIPGGPADKGGGASAAQSESTGVASTFNSRQRAGSAMQREALLNQVATQTNTDREEVDRLLREGDPLRGLDGPSAVAQLLAGSGKRFFQGRILGNIPIISEWANEDVSPYSEGAARGQAMINDPAGPITNPDVEGARAMVPSFRQPVGVQANLVESMLRLGGAGGRTQAPRQVEPPQGAIEALMRNPGLSAQFDEKYGDGAAAAWLGQ